MKKMKKFNLTFLTLILLFSGSLFAQSSQDFPFIRGTNFSKLSPKMRAKLHKQMTTILVQMEKKEKFPKYYKSKYSSTDPILFLDRLTNYLMNDSIASDDSNACLFGGWPSQRSGRCSVPWSSGARAVASSLETQAYDRDSYCGDSGLFRCNPLIFGPGIDQGMVGDSYPNINGRRNNDVPYHAGICVDISRGYDGLSERCQAASDRLDELRREHNMAPWRESDFFNEERAAQFRGLQNLVADRCRANREALNGDNMCTSLENSLGLTAAAVEAGRISGINTEDMFPQCAGTTPPPRCDDDTHNSFDNIIAAISRIRGNRECNFQAIQAIDGDSLTNSMEFTPGRCLNPIEGALRTSGLPDSETEFAFYFHGADGPMGRINIPITKDTTQEEIVRALTTGDNQDAFNNLCNNAACPRAQESHRLSGLYAALESIKNRENCNFGRVQAVDSATGDIEAFEPRSCDLSVEGRLASEGLPYQAGVERGRQERVPIAINLRDRSGTFLATLRLDASSDFTEGDYTAQLDQDALQAACVASNSANRRDDESALPDVGITEGTYVPEFWQSRIADLRNVAEQNNIDGFRIEVRPNGDIVLHATDPNDILAHQVAFMGVINNGAPGATMLRDGDTGVLIQGTPPATRVEALAHANAATLTAEERQVLIEAADGIMQGDGDITSIERDANGVIRLTLSGPPSAGFDGEFNGYRVVQENRADGRGSRLVMTPASAPAPDMTVMGIRREPGGDEGGDEGGDPRISPDGVVGLAPTHNLTIDPEERLLMNDIWKVENNDDSGLNAAYNLLVETARVAPVIQTRVMEGGRGILVTVDHSGTGGEPFEAGQIGALMDAAQGGSSIVEVAREPSTGRVVYRITR